MKLSLSLIKELLDVNLSAKEMADILTLLGIEVDKIEKCAFSNVVVVEVKKIKKHPSTNLQIAEIFDGKNRFEIVSDASNLREGLVAAFAGVGAEINGKFVEEVEIKGVKSPGRLCSAGELKLFDENDRLLELPKEMIGQDLASLIDPVLEISLTPNLGRCQNALGIARELAAFLQKKVFLPKIELKEIKEENVKDVIIEDKNCFRYTLRTIHGVKAGPSPFWLKLTLESCGIRSINSIVDATNYAMLLLGQPMHAFDLDKVEGPIRIYSSKKEMSFRGLDEKEYKLPADTIIIGDEKKILACGGIMGALSSAISPSTQNIALESAIFDPVTIRKSSKKMGLKTESSQRFEKGVDPDIVLLALDLASSLIQKISGGGVIKKAIDKEGKKVEPVSILLRIEKLNALLGTELSQGEVSSILGQLDCIVTQNKEGFRVTPPKYRYDLNIEEDLIEDVARIYGYNNIPVKEPLAHNSTLEHSPMYLFESRIKKTLISLGLQEFITCDLISSKLADLSLELDFGRSALISVLESNSLDNSVLRPSLLPCLLQIVKFNCDRKENSIHGFEVGRVHFKKGNDYSEQTMASIVLSGSSNPPHWKEKNGEVDFFDLKGVIETLFSSLSLQPVFKKSSHPALHPGRQANVLINDKNVGVIGEIHPHTLKKMDIKQKIFFAELNLNALFEYVSLAVKAEPIPLYPATERDWTVTLKKSIPIARVFEAIKNQKSSLLEKVELLDIYYDDKIGKENINATFHFTYRNKDRTISFAEAEQEHEKNIAKVDKELQKYLLI